jgi:ABC-2 type transport system ATP-binding protein
LQIEPGEIVAFLGPNGARKTTTIDMMLGLARPDSGSVAILGKSPETAIARGEVAAVMQTGGLLEDYTVREAVEFTASLYPKSRPVDEVLERAGIEHVAPLVGGYTTWAGASVVIWTLVFGVGAGMLFRRDTKRQ